MLQPRGLGQLSGMAALAACGCHELRKNSAPEFVDGLVRAGVGFGNVLKAPAKGIVAADGEPVDAERRVDRHPVAGTRPKASSAKIPFTTNSKLPNSPPCNHLPLKPTPPP